MNIYVKADLALVKNKYDAFNNSVFVYFVFKSEVNYNYCCWSVLIDLILTPGI